MKWTLVYTFFRSLTLAHLERSLYSLSKQTIQPDEFVFSDNSTDFSPETILTVIRQYFDPDKMSLHFHKHHDPKRCSATWGMNHAIAQATHDVFIMSRADCIYDFSFNEQLVSHFAMHTDYGANPLFFVATWLLQMGYWSEASHETVDHAADLEPLKWRENVQNLLQNRKLGGQEHKHAHLDAPSYCTTKSAMAHAGWYDENLTGWGYWQMDLQGQMRMKGVGFHVLPEFLYFHMQHQIEGPERSQPLAMQEYNSSPRRQDPNFPRAV